MLPTTSYNCNLKLIILGILLLFFCCPAPHRGSEKPIYSNADSDKATETDNKTGKDTAMKEKSSVEEGIRKTTDKTVVQDSSKKDIGKKTATSARQDEDDLRIGNEGENEGGNRKSVRGNN